MSLTSSLYTGISGLTTLGNSMQIIGDNISNVNTVGFKNSRYVFQDVLSQSVATQSGSAQIGRGTAMGDIGSVFEQGSFESTGNSTDLGISGSGFFVLSDADSDEQFYTRAGNFEFDRNGVLATPEGYVVQGWELDNEGNDMGAVTDIIMDSFTSAPDESSRLSAITNLDSDAVSQTEVLSNTWDSSNTTPLSASNYEYQTTVKVYDSLGSTHDVTIYYDKKSGNDWEYVMTANPEEDKRNLVQGTDSMGILARGIVTYSDSSGTISNMTMQRMDGLIGNITTAGSLIEEDVEMTIQDYTGVTLDGHGFRADFAAGAWGLTTIPANYAAAAIITDTDSQISLDLNGDGNVDLTVDLRVAALAGDSVSFDVNAPLNLHEQSITPTYSAGLPGGTFGTQDNTTMTIDDPTTLLANDQGLAGTGIVYQYTTGGGWVDPIAAVDWTAPEYTSLPGGRPAIVDNSADKFSLDMNGDGTADVTYNFETSLTGDTSITFDVEGTTAWSDVSTNTNGYFDFVTDFLGGSVSGDNPHGTKMFVEYDIGTRDDGTGFFVNSSLTSTQYARSSSTIFQTADGYGAGDLQGVDVAVDGTITGVYSNGELIPLYRVALAKFLNVQGLYKEGGNLYRETRDSGAATTNKPGTNGLGNIQPNSLEQSNVDIASEFVKMISSQRGFQANSKIITTVDGMLGEVIAMKR